MSVKIKSMKIKFDDCIMIFFGGSDDQSIRSNHLSQLSLGALQKPRADTHTSNKKFLLTGINLEQDQAHIGGGVLLLMDS